MLSRLRKEAPPHNHTRALGLGNRMLLDTDLLPSVHTGRLAGRPMENLPQDQPPRCKPLGRLFVSWFRCQRRMPITPAEYWHPKSSLLACFCRRGDWPIGPMDGRCAAKCACPVWCAYPIGLERTERWTETWLPVQNSNVQNWMSQMQRDGRDQMIGSDDWVDRRWIVGGSMDGCAVTGPELWAVEGLGGLNKHQQQLSDARYRQLYPQQARKCSTARYSEPMSLPTNHSPGFGFSRLGCWVCWVCLFALFCFVSFLFCSSLARSFSAHPGDFHPTRSGISIRPFAQRGSRNCAWAHKCPLRSLARLCSAVLCR